MTNLEMLKEIARRAQGYIDRGEPIPMEAQPVLMELIVALVDVIEALPADVLAEVVSHCQGTDFVVRHAHSPTGSPPW